jgi:hypothetical protein
MSVPGAGQEPNPQAGQEPGGANPPAATPQTPSAAGQEPAAGAAPETFSREYVEQLRREAADFRKRATTAENKVTDHERQQLSETERLTAEVADWKTRATDLESRYQTALIRAAVDREAVKQGAVDPDAVFALMDRSGLKLDDEGAVTGADKAVKKLLEDKAYLKAAQGSNGHGGPPQTPKPADQRALSEQQRSEAQAELSQRYARSIF